MNPPDLHSFPTRRSSDLARIDAGGDAIVDDHAHAAAGRERAFARREGLVEDPVARLKEPAANHQERNYRTAATFTQNVERHVARDDQVAVKLAREIDEFRTDADPRHEIPSRRGADQRFADDAVVCKSHPAGFEL